MNSFKEGFLLFLNEAVEYFTGHEFLCMTGGLCAGLMIGIFFVFSVLTFFKVFFVILDMIEHKKD